MHDFEFVLFIRPIRLVHSWLIGPLLQKCLAQGLALERIRLGKIPKIITIKSNNNNNNDDEDCIIIEGNFL